MLIARLVWALSVLQLSVTWGHSPEILLAPPDPRSTASIPLRLWANPRQAAFRPRKRDLHPGSLMTALGSHFDPEWMSLSKPHRPPMDNMVKERASVRRLQDLAASLPLSDALTDWLVTRATCPVQFVWRDLGLDFWPRWVRTAECHQPPIIPCSWPPGMSCVPGPPKHLFVLRWHCRLRKNAKNKKKASENNVWGPSTEKQKEDKKKDRKTRKKYRCLWIKVPYPVPEDCTCGCA